MSESTRERPSERPSGSFSLFEEEGLGREGGNSMYMCLGTEGF